MTDTMLLEILARRRGRPFTTTEAAAFCRLSGSTPSASATKKDRLDLGLITRERAAEETRQRTAELEELRAEADVPVSLMARREELRTLVDDWASASAETRRALVASIFESLQPLRAAAGSAASAQDGSAMPRQPPRLHL